MEIESLVQSLKKILEEKSKIKGIAHGKKTRDLTMKSPSQKAPNESSYP